MAQLTISALLFAALIATVAATTTYTTVVTTTTTTTEDEINPRGQSCQQQMQPQQISHCRMWMMKESGGGGADEEPFLRSAVANPMEEHLKQCCDQLRNIKSECRCEAIRSMMREMPSQQYGGKMEEMMATAASLPGRFCGMKSPAYCQMKTMYY